MKNTHFFIIIMQVYIQESCNQIITLDNYDHSASITTCIGGLTVNDKFILTGQVDATGTVASDWPLNILIVTRQNDLQIYTKLCDVNIAQNGCGSSLKDSFPCYCKNKTGDVYNYVVNETATLSLSNNEIQGQWIKSNNKDARATDVKILPTIYDTVSYTVNGIKETSLDFKYKDDNYIECCILNLKDPYSLKIEWDGNIINSSTSACATAVINPQALTIFTLVLSYEENDGCKRNDSFKIPVNVKAPSSVDNTDTIVGVVVGVGSCFLIVGIVIAVLVYKKEKPKCSDSKIIVVIVVTVAGSVVIVGIVIGLLYYCNVCKFKKANKQPKGLTLTETTPPTNETSARHIQTKKPLTPLAPLPPHKISPTISGNNERASNLTESNETPNDSSRRKKSKKKRARRKIENGGKNDEQ